MRSTEPASCSTGWSDVGGWAGDCCIADAHVRVGDDVQLTTNVRAVYTIGREKAGSHSLLLRLVVFSRARVDSSSLCLANRAKVANPK